VRLATLQFSPHAAHWKAATLLVSHAFYGMQHASSTILNVFQSSQGPGFRASYTRLEDVSNNSPIHFFSKKTGETTYELWCKTDAGNATGRVIVTNLQPDPTGAVTLSFNHTQLDTVDTLQPLEKGYLERRIDQLQEQISTLGQ